MDYPSDADFLNRFKKKKTMFKATLSIFSQFFRDWCGVEYEYASKLLMFTDKSSSLSQLEKIKDDQVMQTIKCIKEYLLATHSSHYELSKTLELISAQEIPRFKWDFKETCTELLEAAKISGQEYRNKLTVYASCLLDSKAKASESQNDQLQLTKSLMQEAKDKNLKILKEIRESMKEKSSQIKESLKCKIAEAIENKVNESSVAMSAREVYSEKIFEDKENGIKIIEAWLAPRLKETHILLEKLIEENRWVVTDDGNIIDSAISSTEAIIKEIALKCRNSVEYWEEFIGNFIKEITVKITQSSYSTLPVTKKEDPPTLAYLLSNDEDFAGQEFEKYFKNTEKSSPDTIFQICLRLESLMVYTQKLPSLFCYMQGLDQQEDCFIRVQEMISLLIDILSYRIIKIELSSLFLSLYEPYGMAYHLQGVTNYFQRVAESLLSDIIPELMHKSFLYFMECWKLSVLKSKPSKSPEEKTQELRNDIKIISIFFEAKQSDGLVQGISRLQQKEYLQNNFDAISLCINSSEDLMKRLKTAVDQGEKTSIAWILIARGENLYLKFLVDHKSMLCLE